MFKECTSKELTRFSVLLQYYNRFTALWILSRWAGTRRNIHSHLSQSSIIPYLLPPSITIHGIFRVKFTCLTVFLHNLYPGFLWSTSWSGTMHFLIHTFLHPVTLSSFCSTRPCPYHRNLFCVVPKLCHLILVSLSTLYLELYLVA